MDYAELSTVFQDTYGIEEPEFDAYTDIPMEAQTIRNEPVQQKIHCNDYDNHIENCARCMIYQTKKRTNVLNIIIIMTLLWMILRR